MDVSPSNHRQSILMAVAACCIRFSRFSWLGTVSKSGRYPFQKSPKFLSKRSSSDDETDTHNDDVGKLVAASPPLVKLLNRIAAWLSLMVEQVMSILASCKVIGDDYLQHHCFVERFIGLYSMLAYLYSTVSSQTNGSNLFYSWLDTVRVVLAFVVSCLPLEICTFSVVEKI